MTEDVEVKKENFVRTGSLEVVTLSPVGKATASVLISIVGLWMGFMSIHLIDLKNSVAERFAKAEVEIAWMKNEAIEYRNGKFTKEDAIALASRIDVNEYQLAELKDFVTKIRELQLRIDERVTRLNRHVTDETASK